MHKVIEVLVALSRRLGARADYSELERVAVMVHRIMSYQSRQYHTLEHVFGFMDGADDIAALAAVFHDLVYIQVDDGLPSDAHRLLEPYILWADGKAVLRDVVTTDRDYELCRRLFGSTFPVAEKGAQGLNEFLSALLLLKLMGSILPRGALVAAAACIEATIPFRVEVGAPLEERLRSLAQEGNAGYSMDEVGPMVARAIAFANEDVRDFRQDDPAAFLSNTWKLLPETNEALRHKGAYSIREYRAALHGMLKFFRSLEPGRVFHSYMGYPGAEDMAALEEKVRRNLNHSTQYLRAKLLALGLIEATAELSGGDAPIALFMGDIPSEGVRWDSLMDHLIPSAEPAWLERNHPVIRLLRDGRLEESTFDLRNSPLALWLYSRLKPELWARLETRAEEYFAGSCAAAELLEGLPRDVRKELLGACAAMAPTRRDLLLSLC